MTPTMFPGPDVDGRPTWLCAWEAVPAGYEYRHQENAAWQDIAAKRPLLSGDERRWVQVRRVPPAPGDRIGVVLIDSLGDALTQPEPITFAELCEVLIDHEPPGPGAVPPWSGPPEEFRANVADATLALADAIWARLTDGDRG